MSSSPSAVPSKGQTNRAGKLWAEAFKAYRQDGPEALARFDGDELLAADAVIEWWRSLHAQPLRNVNANLRYYLNELKDGGYVTQRLKKRWTIVDKLCRQPTMALTTMEDIGGCRVIVKDQKQAYHLRSRLRKNWQIHRDRDYVAEPKESGYRALHLIVRRKSRLIEVQIRTPLQDLWANQVEADSRRLRVDLKSGAGTDVVHGYYVAVSQFLELKERGEDPDKELMDRLAEAYQAATPYLLPSRASRPPTRRKKPPA